ncbi:Flp family type IVb pilin [Mitsuokella multacida]|uniref:Uncharacterized protein n=1 Tax=Mitsuokella multacida TaxID=52226 RepID=A0A414NX23_9FIRM|nr:hypothetical protein [Mitsuokella multacida]RHF51805.1 hypothetical protein DW674_06175 [Mitsuokella multacida]
MWKKKGQGIVEYALILAFVVGIGGVLFANGNLADSIRSVFSNVNIQLDPATTPQDIIERLRQGRYDGLAKDELKRDKNKTLIITSDSAEGQALAQKLNIQPQSGDAWFARIQTDGTTVFSYYSAAANGGMTYDTLKAEYQNHPTVRIAEGLFNSMGKSTIQQGTAAGQTYWGNVKGYVGKSPNGNGIIIDPTPIDRIK